MEARDVVLTAVGGVIVAVIAAITAAAIKGWNAYVTGYGKIKKVDADQAKWDQSLSKKQQALIDERFAGLLKTQEAIYEARETKTQKQLEAVLAELNRLETEHVKCHQEAAVMRADIQRLMKKDESQQQEINVLRAKVAGLEPQR